MARSIKVACAAILSTCVAAQAFANDTYTDPNALGASLFGSSDTVVYIDEPGTDRAQTVDAVLATEVAAPFEGASLDMSGVDGSLRACYEAGGIAKQADDLSYFCTYLTTPPSVTATASVTGGGVPVVGGSVLSQDTYTGYDGTTNVEDPVLIDCVERGGTLIQLASNEAFACAM